nr:MAG TPA: hypothetical protein [Caudoviricetes sp.]
MLAFSISVFVGGRFSFNAFAKISEKFSLKLFCISVMNLSFAISENRSSSLYFSFSAFRKSCSVFFYCPKN